MFKIGDKIEIGLRNSSMGRVWEAAKIVKPCRHNPPPAPGYHLVRFAADGAKLYVHQNGFRLAK